jgi:hypothetical protein
MSGWNYIRNSLQQQITILKNIWATLSDIPRSGF